LFEGEIVLRTISVIGIILLLLLSSLSFNTVGGDNKGHIIYVDDDGTADYTRIQDAIDNARDGDTIYVYNGEYSETINISKELVLQGEDKENTIIRAEEETVLINKDNVTINDFSIISTEIFGYMIIVETRNNLIENNNILGIEETGSIMVRYSADNNVIQNNRIIGGIWIRDSNNNEINNNYVYFISIHESSSTIIFDNDISMIRANGIHIDGGNGNIISNNVIHNCMVGINIRECPGQFIRNNDFFLNERNADIYYPTENNCNWFHNYWGASEEEFSFPWILPLPYPVIGKKNYYDFGWLPAKLPNNISLINYFKAMREND
jgi:parallel beta-helix repeat protein